MVDIINCDSVIQLIVRMVDIFDSCRAGDAFCIMIVLVWLPIRWKEEKVKLEGNFLFST